MNAKLLLKCEELIGDLDGIQRKDLEWTLKRYEVDNDNNINTKLYWNVKWYRVDNDDESIYGSNIDDTYGNIQMLF